jgi:outer membrane protein OmpA-like peptidoglycan-associated protein/opacity protein-like surface antigen
MTSRLTSFLSVLLAVVVLQGAQTLAPTLLRAQSDTSTTSRINFDDLTADADKPLFLRYGIFGGINWNYHVARFADFEKTLTCCSQNYGETVSMLYHAGLLFEAPIQNRFGASLRLSYTQMGVDFRRIDQLYAATPNGAQDVDIAHENKITLGLLGIEPYLTYRVLDGLTLYAGLRTGLFLQNQFNYIERMADTDPNNLVNFLLRIDTIRTITTPLRDSIIRPIGVSTRNATSGTIPALNQFNLSLMGGISYEIPLNATGTWLLAPEVFFSYALTQPANNLEARTFTSGNTRDSNRVIKSVGDWAVNNLRVSLSLRYSPFRTIRPELTPALQETIKQIKKLDSAITVERVQNAKRLQQVDSINKAITVKVAELKKVGISVNISKIVGIDADGREIPKPKLVIEQFRKSITQPLLSAIFFEENSFTFPSRYRRLKAAERGVFKIADVGGKSNLEVYRQLLNVVGKRMEDNAAAVLFLTGCNANVGPEVGNQKLSEQRAQAISDYLQDVWKIPAKRIIIQKRDLPENPANSADANGAAENRRVDMSSNLPEIFAPFKTDQIARIPNPPTIRFGLEINAGAGLKQWNLEVTQFADDESVTLKEFNGTSTYQPEVDWKLDLEPNSVPVSGQDLTVQLGMTDISNKNGDAPLASIPVEQINVQKKELDGKADKRIDLYDIIGFTGGANPVLDEINQKTLTDLKAVLKPNATVVINAYSENVGDAAQNKQLAQKRADVVAKILGVANAKINAIGPTTMHDNQAAEGRIYNRLVRVEVQTPTK